MRPRILVISVVFLLVIASSLPVQAQNRFGVYGGLNFARMGGDFDRFGSMLAGELENQFGGTWSGEKSSLTGFGIGISYLVPTSPELGFQFGGQYIRRGTGFDVTGQNITDPNIPSEIVVDTRFKLDYLEFPLLLRFSPGQGKSVRPVIEFGAVPGFKVGADLEIEVLGQSASQDFSQAFSDFTFGVMGGLGMDARLGESTHLLVQARYHLGLVNQIDDSTVSSKSGDVGVFAGLEFPLKTGGAGTGAGGDTGGSGL